MKISRTAFVALWASWPAVVAFTTVPPRRTLLLSSRVAARSARQFLSAPLARGVTAKRHDRSNKRNLVMLFGNLSSLFETKIDYSKLDHPGPELAEMASEGKVLVTSPQDSNLKVATFAGGCFWGLELAYQRVPGVVHTAVGYAQGTEENPTYGQVCSGTTGHTEAVIVYYDDTECSYETLLDTFFARVNPTTINGQGNDFGTQYRTGVYFHSPEQEKMATKRFEEERPNYNAPIATELKAATPFWPAEKHHQQYLERGAGFGRPQSAEKGSTDPIRCYG